MLSILRQLSLLQKGILLAVVIVIPLLFVFFSLKKSPLHSPHSIKKMLEKEGIVFQEEEGSILIGEKRQEKGFELFDTNTWIKGEKELQVLEMRALKGQLERDLTHFESIRSAHVILDIAPVGTPLRPSLQKTKASLILATHDGGMIHPSLVIAIADYVSGGVKGLDPSMIAISDTRGRVYKSFGTDIPPFTCHVEEERLPPIVESAQQKNTYWHFLAFLPLGLIPLFAWKKKRFKLERENPETIASLLTKTSPKKAEKILATLPRDLQEEVLLILAEMDA